MSIIAFIAGVLHSVGSIFSLKACANRQRREAEKDVADQDAVLKVKTDEIKEAVYTCNDARLNEIVLGLMRPILACTVLFAGCSSHSPVVYIPTDRKIESCTNSIGISCKAVPDALFVEMLERLQELRDLKAEMRVDKRIAK